MPLDLGLSDAGLVVPRTADYLDDIRATFVGLAGFTPDWDSDLVYGILTAIAAQKLGDISEVLQAVYDAFDANNATGVQLSNIARLNGVRRRKAVKAVATVTCTGDPGTAITVGKIVEGGGSDGRARWVVTEDVLIPAEGTVDVVVEAELAGRTVATAGEIDTIVTPVTGWDSVTNAEGASPGSDAETDDDLRLRREQSIQIGAAIGIRALRAALLALGFVDACAVIDNPDNEDKLVEGISMPAHSTLVILLPDTLTVDQQTEVLQLIYDKTPVATRHAGTDVVGGVIGEDGFTKSVSFDYAVELTANITVDLTMATGYSTADAGPALLALVDAHIDALLIGDDLRELQLMALAAEVQGVIGATFLINGFSNLSATAVQKVVRGTWTVT